MKTGPAGIGLIKKFESCRLTAYQDVIGVWTIGWGHTDLAVVPRLTWSQEKADEVLGIDLHRFEDAVNKYVKVPLTQNQFDALVCFTYNVGAGNLKASELLKQTNAGASKDKTAPLFSHFNHAGGKVLAGLTRRRAAEAALWAS